MKNAIRLVGIFLLLIGSSGCDISVPTQAATAEPPPLEYQSNQPPAVSSSSSPGTDPRVDGLISSVDNLNSRFDQLFAKLCKPASEPQPKAGETGVVYFYSAPPCPPGFQCPARAASDKARGEIEAAIKMGATNPRFEFREATPALIKWVRSNYQPWPVQQWQNSKGEWITRAGWTMLQVFQNKYEATLTYGTANEPDDFSKRIDGMVDRLDKMSATQQAKEQRRAAGTNPAGDFDDAIYFSGYGGSQWSWPGDLRVHLLQPPHSLSRAEVRRMTRAQCIAVHSAYHNRYGLRIRGSVQYATYSSDDGAVYETVSAKDRSKRIARLQAKIDRLQNKPGIFAVPVRRTYRVRYSTGFCPTC